VCVFLSSRVLKFNDHSENHTTSQSDTGDGDEGGDAIRGGKNVRYQITEVAFCVAPKTL
jgi:hypothetical protein